MKVTYIGQSKQVEFDGVQFPQSQAVEYDGALGETLRANRFFEVEQDEPKPFPTDSKDELEAWARENLNLELDKRKAMKNLIAQVEAALSDQ